MSKVKTDLANKNAVQMLQYGRNVSSGLNNNPYVPTPAPTRLLLDGGITLLQTTNDDYEATKDLLKSKLAARNAALKSLAGLLRAEAATVQTATGGDAAKILSTGFEVAAAGHVAAPAQVLDLRVTASDHEGMLKASWKRVVGVTRYELQASIDPPTATSWVLKASSSKTNTEINSFTSGQRIWLRVRAINAAGEGAWSDPAVKTVP